MVCSFFRRQKSNFVNHLKLFTVTIKYSLKTIRYCFEFIIIINHCLHGYLSSWWLLENNLICENTRKRTLCVKVLKSEHNIRLLEWVMWEMNVGCALSSLQCSLALDTEISCSSKRDPLINSGWNGMSSRTRSLSVPVSDKSLNSLGSGYPFHTRHKNTSYSGSF